MGTLRQGSKVPAFSAAATGATRVDSEILLGSPYVLYFYPMDNTPGCVFEGRDFSRHHEQFVRRGAAVFGVSRDTIDSHEKFKARHGFPFELIADEDEKLCGLFGVIREKVRIGRKLFGVERSTFLIDAEGVLRREWRKVRLPGHVDEILKALDEL
ncbi:MAG: peroxiredoxin [Rhodospirillaceae bacterium]|nr:peroxiredoxin [Rhodospirillaceae bacterium]